VSRAPSESRRGFAFGVTAYFLWGLFPLYWPLLEPAGSLEILADRIVFSLAFVCLLLWRTKGWGDVRAVLRDRRQRSLLSVAAIFVTTNWGVYIWGVDTGHVIETSLGYFINPLLTILLGVFVLHERLRRTQWIAVGVASIAIVILSVDYGRPPWIALILAGSFGLYGFLKKKAAVGALESLAVETGAVTVPALAVLVVLYFDGSLAIGSHGAGNSLLLMGTGIVTAIPLLFFGAATRRLPLSAIGLLQYLTPILQFAVGVGVDHEAMPAARWAGFGLVWVALAILSADGLRHQRAASRPVRTETVSDPSMRLGT
jgi:chloramphenicol-sensitive protein RarD